MPNKRLISAGYGSLLDWRPPRVANSETSREAADSVAESAGTLRAKVLAYLKTNGPQTDEELQLALRMNPSTERPRRIELVRCGLVRDSGRRATTNSGRSAVLWESVR